MAKKEDVTNLTKCPICALESKEGNLLPHEHRKWLCDNCGHVYTGLSEILKRQNVVNTVLQRQERVEKSARGVTKIKEWQELPADKELREQLCLEFAKIDCFYSGARRTRRNQTLFVQRLNREVGWVCIDMKHYCPKCYSNRYYEKH